MVEKMLRHRGETRCLDAMPSHLLLYTNSYLLRKSLLWRTGNVRAAVSIAYTISLALMINEKKN